MISQRQHRNSREQNWHTGVFSRPTWDLLALKSGKYSPFIVFNCLDYQKGQRLLWYLWKNLMLFCSISWCPMNTLLATVVLVVVVLFLQHNSSLLGKTKAKAPISQIQKKIIVMLTKLEYSELNFVEEKLKLSFAFKVFLARFVPKLSFSQLSRIFSQQTPQFFYPCAPTGCCSPKHCQHKNYNFRSSPFRIFQTRIVDDFGFSKLKLLFVLIIFSAHWNASQNHKCDFSKILPVPLATSVDQIKKIGVFVENFDWRGIPIRKDAEFVCVKYPEFVTKSFQMPNHHSSCAFAF